MVSLYPRIIRQSSRRSSGSRSGWLEDHGVAFVKEKKIKQDTGTSGGALEPKSCEIDIGHGV
jgi:hypothetical protein